LHLGPGLVRCQIQSLAIGDSPERQAWNLEIKAQDLKLIAAVLGYMPVGSCHRLLQYLHHCFIIGEADLQIDGYGLVEVAAGIVLLGPKDGADLKDSIHPRPHQHLLVELGALIEEGLLLEVTDGKEIRSALGSGSHDLGSEDLGHGIFAEEASQAIQDGAFYLEGSQDAGPSNIHEPGIKAGVQLALHLLRGIEGKGHLGGIEHLDLAWKYLKSARGLGLGLDCALHHHHALPADGAGAFEGLLSEELLDQGYLSQPFSVPQHQEGDASQIARLMGKSGQSDLFAIHLRINISGIMSSEDQVVSRKRQ